ncbi:MAG: sulfur carrier protein ThiS [Gemmatimonadales bacterium]
MMTGTTSEVVLTVNGEVRRIPAPATAAGLLEHLGLDSHTVVVEVNRRIVRRPDLERTSLANGDSVELVHFVGGG